MKSTAAMRPERLVGLPAGAWPSGQPAMHAACGLGRSFAGQPGVLSHPHVAPPRQAASG